MQISAEITRLQITISGIVQGVGFRPFVYNLAKTNRLSGFVRNNNGIVEIEAQGEADLLSSFVHDLQNQAPPLAAIKSIAASELPIAIDFNKDFQILASTYNSHADRFIAPDAATCNNCLQDILDQNNRRFRYPFTNCTNCGPRFTIIKALPYDRKATTMASFAMCTLCLQEYNDPTNRRFHAQPNACPECGPTLTFIDSDTTEAPVQAEAALQATLDRLTDGQIVAVKGLGGFHLMLDARQAIAVKALRQKKRRPSKPLAVMMSNIDMVRFYCSCSAEEEAELLSPQRPIVLLKKSNTSSLADEIAPGVDCLGVMLPYTPLHHLLLLNFHKPLVATSANLSEEPIVIDNDDAQSRLKCVTNNFLIHDRDIHSRYDDSVVKLAGKNKMTLRRARGLTPAPIKLPFTATKTALACGAHLKNTFCLIDKDQAFISQHIGDLETFDSLKHFEQTLDTYLQLFDFKPQLIAHDRHPDYISTGIAENLSAKHGLPLFAVQHHHAHIVACMAEHGLVEPVIGVAFDGLGLGDDGTLWGGEFLLSSFKSYQRLAYFRPYAMPGGSQAIKEPWRMALSHILAETDNDLFAPFIDDLKQRYGLKVVEMVKQQITQNLNAPLTSSCGRLFDSLSALLGICHQANYEGQAAIELQVCADNGLSMIDLEQTNDYPYSLTGTKPPFVINPQPILRSAYEDLLQGISLNIIAAKFHHTIANIILDICLKLRSATRINNICLSGGVFQNDLLLHLSSQLLVDEHFQVYSPGKLPANDGGISLGQAVVALANANAIIPDTNGGI